MSGAYVASDGVFPTVCRGRGRAAQGAWEAARFCYSQVRRSPARGARLDRLREVRGARLAQIAKRRRRALGLCRAVLLIAAPCRALAPEQVAFIAENFVGAEGRASLPTPVPRDAVARAWLPFPVRCARVLARARAHALAFPTEHAPKPSRVRR